MALGTGGEFEQNRQSCLLTLRSHIAMIPERHLPYALRTQPENRVAGNSQGVGEGGGKGLQT